MSEERRKEKGEETLEVLFPEGDELLRRGTRVAEFARSLATDAAPTAPVDPGRARSELDGQRTTRIGLALEDLLVLHLAAHLGGGSFAWYGRPRGGAQQAWRTLERFRDELRDLPGVPAPGEGPLAVAGRLLEGLYRLGWETPRLELWRARLERAGGGIERGEAAFTEQLDELAEEGVGARVHAALLAGLVETRLDRGAVREARLVLEEHSAAVDGDRRLGQLRIWGTLLVGELAEAVRLARAAPPWDGILPEVLVELRERWPEALPALSGKAAAAVVSRRAPAGEDDDFPLRSRRPLGASALGVFAFGPGRSVEPVLLDVAPGLRARVDGWLLEREDACCAADQPEHRLVIEARPCFAHRFAPVGARGSGAPTGALGSGALALAHAPVLDGEGEVAGWIHVECEHHLLPTAARLRQIARAWRLPVLRRGALSERIELREADLVFEPRPETVRWGDRDAAARLETRLPEPARELAGEVFVGLVAALGFKMGQRSWWGFIRREGELRFTASSGGGLEGADGHPGGARSLDRCLATRGAVCFDEPDPRLSIHAAAASGLVLPIACRDELIGVLAVESRRRRDFQASDVERHLALASAFALPFRLAGFRAWHLERFGYDLFFDTSSAAFRAFAEQLEIVGGSTSPVVLSGPPGTGKMVLARWIHWLGGGDGRPLEVIGCELDPAPEREWPPLAESRRGQRGGSLVLEEVGALPPPLQEELLRDLESRDSIRVRDGGGGPGDRSGEARWIVTSSRPLSRYVEEERLRADLAARLDRLQLFVPPLADRRTEIPALARFLASRFALEEGCPAPRFSDEALALLWRQSWEGNLRELESLVFKMVLLFPDRELGAEEIHEVARRFRFPLSRKIPPRRPPRADVVAALRTTFKGGRSFNKRRAALYLGWDPDTLVARLGELGIDEESIDAEPPGWGM